MGPRGRLSSRSHMSARRWMLTLGGAVVVLLFLATSLSPVRRAIRRVMRARRAQRLRHLYSEYSHLAINDGRPSWSFYSREFVDCVRAPVLSQQGVTGSCSTLCGDGTGDAFEAFHSADSIRVDASACGHHLHTWPCPGGDADFSHLLQPVDIALRPGSTDHKVFIQVYCADDFAFVTTMRHWLPPHRAPVIVDAGANIGAATLLLSHLSALQGRVFAVEAAPENLEVLAANTAALGAAVTILPKALVPHALAVAGHTLEFGGGRDDFWGFRVEHGRPGAEGRGVHNAAALPAVVHSVETTSLPLLRALAGAPLDFIKLDVEGEEKAILEDAASVEVLCGALCVFLETHDRFVPGCSAAFDAFMAKGCPDGSRFKRVALTGEYHVVCRGEPF